MLERVFLSFDGEGRFVPPTGRLIHGVCVLLEVGWEEQPIAST